MKNRVFYLMSVLLVTITVYGQSQPAKRGFLSFDGTTIFSLSDPRLSMLKMAWASDDPGTQVDPNTLYGSQQSLLMESAQGKDVRVQFHFSNRDIVGKKIVFSGKYKYQQAQNAKVQFLIVLDTFLRTYEHASSTVECNGEQDWQSFSVEMPLERTSNFFFRLMSSGGMKLWISDCQVQVDGQSFDILVKSNTEAQRDMEYIRGSRVSIQAPTQQTFENLEVLGKVWGFLKYYHPQVVIGKYNWDFELFRILPEIASAPDKEQRNKRISKWIDKYGEITETEDYTVTDSAQYHRFAHLGWLEDRNLFDEALSAKLVKIKNAKRNSVFNYYLPPLAGKEETEFRRELLYPSISWEDQGYRLLTLYRLWNAIEYGFPYVDLTDHPWSSILAKYLPEFISTPSEEELNRSIQKVTTEINDSHGGIHFPKPAPPMRGLPMGLTLTDEGKYAVESTHLREIDRGSVILAVNNKLVSEIIEDYRPLLPSSNERGLIRNVAPLLFLTQERETKVTVEFEGKVHKRKVPTQVFTSRVVMERKRPEDYHLKSKGIIYANVGDVSAEDLERLMQKKENAKGLILDMRRYPRGYTKDILEHYLYPRPTPYMWFSMNSKKYPGNFFLDIKGDVGLKENPDYFKGKIAILVNEMTQSLGELSAIAYRVAPRSAIIGTQTAGANGHIGYFYLPRGIKILYTMAGTFYPGWGVHQRTGVKIDIPVEQTVKDVEDGEDMWIKKAIEYIEEAN